MNDDAPTQPITATPTRPAGHRRLADRALTVGAVLGALCLLATVVALIFGIRPLIFETGSMAPTIPVGSLGISKTIDANRLEPGDVATVVRDDGTRVTHRVVSVDAKSSASAELTMQGDANSAPDPNRYIVADARRVLFTVPILGYVASWLANPLTLTLQALAVAALLAIAFAPARGWRNTKIAHRLLAGTAAVTVIAVAASGIHGSGPARAAQSDQATATGALATGWEADPISLACTASNPGFGLSKSVQFSWPNVAQPDPNRKFVLSVTKGSSTEADTFLTSAYPANSTITKDITGGSFWTWLWDLLFGGGDTVLTISLRAYDYLFPSQRTLTVQVQFHAARLLPPALPYLECLSPSSVSRAAPKASPSGSATASTSAAPSSSAAPSTSESPSTAPGSSESKPAQPSTTDSPSATPELPPGGTLTSSGQFAFYDDGGAVTIRDATSTEVVYRGSFPSSSSVRWLPQSERLEITEPDGTVVVVSRSGGVWSEARTPPPTTAAPNAPSAEAPAAQPETSVEPVPVAPAG